MEKKSGLLHTLGPGRSFALGVMLSLLIIFAVGFFYLLFSDGGLTDLAKKDSPAAAFNTDKKEAADPKTTDQKASDINIKPISDEDHVKGDLSKAEVVVVEFSDTECPFCKRFHDTMNQVVADYGDKVAWVYRHFPLTSLHPKAPKEAEATECAAELGGNEGFWAFTDRLFEITPSNNRLEESQLSEIAEYSGLNVAQFESCLESGKYAQEVEEDLQDAQAAGGRGTPYSVIITKDGQKIPLSGALPVERVKATIDPLLQ